MNNASKNSVLWVWVFFVFLLILLAAVVYCNRDSLASLDPEEYRRLDRFVGYTSKNPQALPPALRTDSVDVSDADGPSEPDVPSEATGPAMRTFRLQVPEGPVGAATAENKVTTRRPRPKRDYRKRPSAGELECKRVLERMFGVTFERIRPDFLRNPETGKNLELDNYNEELMLAVEYSGIQHYVHPNFTGQTFSDFIAQYRRDQFKVKACECYGVHLIVVPYTVKIDDIQSYIACRLPERLLGIAMIQTSTKKVSDVKFL